MHRLPRHESRSAAFSGASCEGAALFPRGATGGWGPREGLTRAGGHRHAGHVGAARGRYAIVASQSLRSLRDRRINERDIKSLPSLSPPLMLIH